MPAYKIIGADQKEYGPISVEQLREWVNEGRVNGQTMARPEDQIDWKPLSAYPEFADLVRSAMAPVASTTYVGARGVSAETVLARDFNLDIGSCIARSWELLKQNFWPVVGMFALIWAITFIVNLIISFATRPAMYHMIENRHVSATGLSVFAGSLLLRSPIYTLLAAGLVKYYLMLIRAEAPTMADAFAGFGPAALQLILLGLVTWLLEMIGVALCIIPGIYLSVSWIFGLPLVIDRNLNFWEAMELSRRIVGKHWFITFAFVLVVGLLGACGVLACLVGLFVTAPLALIALLYAYEDIFSRQGP